jgi:hypothetical protein
MSISVTVCEFTLPHDFRPTANLEAAKQTLNREVLGNVKANWKTDAEIRVRKNCP